MISNHSEGTFERLRYSLGGDRPSQTVRQTLSPHRIHGARLEIQLIKGGIPMATPRKLASASLSLPPILYIMNRIPISNYSKAPRGLSVLSRVTCIFTGIKISPSLWPRQCPNRYTFPAVHWGFNSNLRIIDLRQSLALLLTFQHWAGVSPYTTSYDLAETCVFGKQSLGPIHCGSIA